MESHNRRSTDIDLAVTKEKVFNIESWTIRHETHDNERFDKMFKFMQDGFEDQKESALQLMIKVNSLWDIYNQNIGQNAEKKVLSKFGYFLASSIGGIIATAIPFLVGYFHKGSI